jgi:hypothetical protein
MRISNAKNDDKIGRISFVGLKTNNATTVVTVVA